MFCMAIWIPFKVYFPWREKAGCLGSSWFNAPWEWHPYEKVFWWEKTLYQSVQQQLKWTSFNNKLSLPYSDFYYWPLLTWLIQQQRITFKKSLHYGNVYGFGFLSFFSSWVIGVARISGVWQMELFSNGSFFHLEITTGFEYLLV